MEEHKNWSILTFGAKLDNVAVEIENECREIFPHFFQPQENIVVYSKAQLKQFAEGIQLPKLEIPKIKIGASKLVLTKTPNVNVALEQHALGKEMKELLETVKSYDEKVPSLIAKNLQAKLPLAFYPFGQVADLQFLKPKLKKISHIFTEATSVTNLCQEHHNNLKTKLFPLILMHQGKEASALWKAVTESHITWKEQLATSISHIVDHMQASITSAYPNGDYDTDDTLILDSIKDLNDELPTIGDPGDDQ